MDNQEILEKAKKDTSLDEREKSLFKRAETIAYCVMAIFMGVIIMTAVFLELHPIYLVLLAVLHVYLGTHQVALFAMHNKHKGLLILGIVYFLIAVILTILFIFSLIYSW
jgi:hypothetical protein